MNILFLSHYFPPEGNAPASRTYENSKRWVNAGHRVTVITGVPNVPDGIIYPGYRNLWRQWENTDGIRVLRVKTYIAPNKGFLRRILNYLSFMFSSLQALWGTSDAEVVIATSPQFFCAVGGFILSRMKRLPFIMEVRDLWPESIIAVGAVKNRFVIRLLTCIEEFLYRHADSIFVVTESFKKIIASKGIDENKISVIKNGVDFSRFIPQEKESCKKSLLLEDKFVVSYIGTMGMAHALESVLNVAEELQEYEDICFLFVGSGAEKDRLIRLAEQKHLKNVIFTGRQPKDKIPAYYAASNICLVPLRKTPLFETVIPSKMFEIMAMERAIIQSVEGEAKEILLQSQGGICIEPENQKCLKDAILYLHRHPDDAAMMGKNGRRFVEKFYDRDRLAEDYINIITKQS